MFAALEIATGQVYAKTNEHKKREDFRRFLDGVVAELPSGREIHVILDNYCTHKRNDDRLAKYDSSLFGVGRTARPVTASTVGARPIVQVGDRGNDAPWKARKTNFRFSLPSHRPWKSRLGAISTFPPSRRRFGDDALNSEQARPAVHASFIDPKAPPTQRFFATHTKQRGGQSLR